MSDCMRNDKQNELNTHSSKGMFDHEIINTLNTHILLDASLILFNYS